MPTDIEIARSAKKRPIHELAEALEIDPENIIPYGHDKAKIATGHLTAIKSKPNGKLIDAEKAGVAVDDRGFIAVDAQQRTGVNHIFAIGDVVGQPMLAHKAVHEGKVAAEVCAGEKRFFDAKLIPSVAYTDPEVAWCGLTETEAKAKGGHLTVQDMENMQADFDIQAQALSGALEKSFEVYVKARERSVWDSQRNFPFDRLMVKKFAPLFKDGAQLGRDDICRRMLPGFFVALGMMLGPDVVEEYQLAVLVENEPGVLARVTGLFSGRGYNIESLTVAEVSNEENLSRITIVTSGTPMIIEQIKAQLSRLVPIHAVKDLTIEGPSVERELALVKVGGSGEKRVESLRIADIFRARVLDSTNESFVFEIVGDTGKLSAFIELMKPLGLVDVSRTGVVAIARGTEAL